MTPREDVSWLSHGTRVAAYLYRPAGALGDVPCVVMAHGFTAVRDQALPAYAERFAAEGFAVLLFDYRHFGASEGEPRQLLDIAKQHEDFRTAIAYARGLDGVDPDRIALFGSSFSGGHVVTLAAEDNRIAAVVAQVPFADGFATLLSLPLKTIAFVGVAAVADQVGALLGRGPRYVDAVGAPGSTATLTDPTAESGFRSIDPPDSTWRNEYAARLMLRVPFYRPVTKASSVQAPVLVSVAERDETVPPAPAAKMGARAPKGEVITYPIGHFDVYLGEPFERAVGDQIAFLRKHLMHDA